MSWAVHSLRVLWENGQVLSKNPAHGLGELQPNNHLIITDSWHWCTSKFPSNCRTKQYFVFIHSHSHFICEFLKSSNELSARQLLPKASQRIPACCLPVQGAGLDRGCSRLLWLGALGVWGSCPAATPALHSRHRILGHTELLKGLISHQMSFLFPAGPEDASLAVSQEVSEDLTGSLDFSSSAWVLINLLLLPSWMLGSSSGLQLLRLQRLP